MTPFLQLAFAIAIILLAAKMAGYLSTLIGQPSVLGELLVGIFLGPSLLDLTHLYFITDTHLGEIIYELGEIGVLLLMFMAGLELNLSDLAKNTRVSAYSGILGVVFPVILGWVAGTLTGMKTDQAIFLGLTLGATSVSISAQTLIELKVLRSRVGFGLLGAAVFDDILVILLLSTFLAITTGGGGFIEVIIVILRMVIFLALSVGLGIWAIPTLLRTIKGLPISQGVLTISIITLLFYGLAAEVVGGMAAITGTFVAGLMFSRTPEKHDLEAGMRSIAYSFFVPIFFISIGLSVNIGDLKINTLWLMLLITVIGIIGKLLGAGLGAKLAKFSWLESLQLGIGMVSRGEVGLIVAQVGIQEGLITSDAFSAIVGMILMTTLITPPMLRASFNRKSVKATA